MTRARRTVAVWAAAILGWTLPAACSRSEAEFTAVRTGWVQEAPDVASAGLRKLALGERVRARRPWFGHSGWLIVREKGEGWIEAAALAPFPLPTHPAYVVFDGAPVRERPEANAGALRALPFGVTIEVSDGAGVAAPGFAAVVEGGVATGFVEASRIRAEPPTANDAIAAAETRLAARAPAEALTFARSALALDPYSPRAIALVAVLQAPEGAPLAFPTAPALATLLQAQPPIEGAETNSVWSLGAELRPTPDDDARPLAILPLATSVRVIRLFGPWVEVAVRRDPATHGSVDAGTLGVAPLPPPEAPPPPATPVETVGWLRGSEVSGAPLEFEAVARAAAVRAASRDDAALVLALAAHAAAPADAAAVDRVIALAVAAGRYDLAVAATRHDPAAPVTVELTTFYGCRGEPRRAVEVRLREPLRSFARSPAQGKAPTRIRAEDLHAGEESFARAPAAMPRDACLADVDEYGTFREEREECPDEPSPEEADGWEAQPAVDAARAGALEPDEAKERVEAYRKTLSRAFPGGPVLRVRLRNRSVAHAPGPAPLFVYGYVRELRGNLGPSDVEVADAEIRALPPVVIPPGGRIDLWLRVPWYTGSVYGVVTAGSPDEARKVLSSSPRRSAVGADAPPGAVEVEVAPHGRYTCVY